MNVQLVPEPFVEIPLELANDLGIKGGDRVKVSSARAIYIAKAMVTRRIKPMMIDGKKTYQIGIPIHWGYRGIAEDAGRTALDRREPAVADGHRSERVHAGVQGLPREGGEGVDMPTGTLQIKAISAHPGSDSRARRAARRRGLQVHRRDHVHRLQGVRSRVRRVERHAVPADAPSTTPTRRCRRRRGTTGT